LLGLLVSLIFWVATSETVRDETWGAAARYSAKIAADVFGVSPRDAFIWRLRLAGLEDSPLAKRWIEAPAEAQSDAEILQRQLFVRKQFKAEQVEAHVFQANLQEGEELLWRLDRTDGGVGTLFASLERLQEDASLSSGQWFTEVRLSSDGQQGNWIVPEDGTYRLVIQPELFANATYTLAMSSGGSLDMPVSGASPQDIGSPFGAPRDGGARRHHGVDIFAPKGTPVVAVTAGRVRTGTSNLGGKHVWLAGGWFSVASPRYYYAHLDEFAVDSGVTLQAGDVLGYVGNTGNAINTPPHLHFGIYTTGGPVDPEPFIQPRPTLPEK